jgi:biopolymer transport protein TolR
MALSTHDAFAAPGRGRRRRGGRGRRGALSEINVTPLVDVMLVLLIIFMISAPLLTAGVPLELPKTEASALQDQSEPLTVSIRQDGSVYIRDQATPFANLAPRLREMAGTDATKPIYVRADAHTPYEKVAQVMASLQVAGFSTLDLVTDTGGPSSGAKPDEAIPYQGPQGAEGTPPP